MLLSFRLLSTFKKSKQINPYLIQQVVLSSGERLPFLCSRATGLPLFEPTVYALASLRSANLSSATIHQALRAVMVLQLVLDDLAINLTQRLQDGRLLELGEIQELVRQCRYPLESIVAAQDRGAKSKVVPLLSKHGRKASGSEASLVDSDTAAIRLMYVHRYLKWRTTDHALRMGASNPLRASFLEAAGLSLDALHGTFPRASARTAHDEREGLADDHLSMLLGAIEPESEANPWTGAHPKARNELIVRWLLELGIRRGELLGVRISDINFQTNEVLIARRADDGADPRKHQPNTKTNARLLPLGERLSRLTRSYVQGPRRATKGARKHDYLFVANGTGRPLTQAAVNKVFEVLRARVPDLPQNLSPHVLRHTWNDEFSKLMDETKVSEEREKQMRSRLMGWSDTSETAATYTRRHTRRKAKEASIALQRKLVPGGIIES